MRQEGWPGHLACVIKGAGCMASDVTLKTLFALNPALDRAALHLAFAQAGHLQVRDVLTPESAHELRAALARGTPWGMAVRAGDGAGSPPQSFSAEALRDPATVRELNDAAQAAARASARGDYGFRYSHCSMVEAVRQGGSGGGLHEIILEHINSEVFLGFVREITGFTDLSRADGNATLFGPNHYLGRHSDSHVAEGWRVAYVLNMPPDDWHPDWGGYLQFLDEEGDIVRGYRPRFNSLNLFAVPRLHSVSYVTPFAPLGRMAISGWFRDW